MSDATNWMPVKALKLTESLNRRNLNLPRKYIELTVDGAILTVKTSEGEDISIFLPPHIRVCRMEG